MEKKIIETFNLCKNYKLKGTKNELEALKDVNLSINEGEIFGLLGPNGAGKTTFVQILSTLVQPTSGYAIIKNNDILRAPKKVKGNIGLMLGDQMLYYRITGYDNLKFFCKIYGVKKKKEKINELSSKLGLENWLNQYVENFSSGMKIKLALARVLLLNRDILFLDEPTLGLDPKSKKEVIEIILSLNKTILLTSHDMNVVKKLCNRIAFIKQGEILKIDTQQNLKNLIMKSINISISIKENKEELINDLNSKKFIENIDVFNKGIKISFKQRKKYAELFAVLQNYPILQIQEVEPSLEDLFTYFI